MSLTLKQKLEQLLIQQQIALDKVERQTGWSPEEANFLSGREAELKDIVEQLENILKEEV